MTKQAQCRAICHVAGKLATHHRRPGEGGIISGLDLVRVVLAWAGADDRDAVLESFAPDIRPTNDGEEFGLALFLLVMAERCAVGNPTVLQEVYDGLTDSAQLAAAQA